MELPIIKLKQQIFNEKWLSGTVSHGSDTFGILTRNIVEGEILPNRLLKLSIRDLDTIVIMIIDNKM